MNLNQACPHCGQVNKAEAAYCGSCGQSLQAVSGAFIYCPYCETANEPGAAFCGNCGRSMPAPAATDGRSVLICPKCESANPLDAVFCGTCATVLAAAPPAAPPPAHRSGWPVLPLLALLALLVLVGGGAAFVVWRLVDTSSETPTADVVAAEPPDEAARPTDESEDPPTAVPATALPTAEPTLPPTALPTFTPIPTVTPLATITPAPESALLTYEFTVDAQTARTTTGLILETGQQAVVSYIGGEWRAGPGPTWSLVDALGDSQVAAKTTFPVPNNRLMLLIGGVGDGPPQPIGDQATLTADRRGMLWLGPNDDGTADNVGSLRVGVSLSEPPLTIQTPLEGGALIRLTFGDAAEYTPALSPDQSRLVYSSELAGGWQLVEGSPNGSTDGFLLTTGPYDYDAPHFSSDGNTLLVSSNLDGDFDIYLLDSSNASVMAQLTDLPGDEYFPRWLQDGTGIVYSWKQDNWTAIYRQDLSGASVELVRAQTFNGFASPSPDGRQVVFYSGRDGDYEIYVMDRDGGNPRRLTTSRGRDASPTFSPDEQWIAFESDRSGNYEIYIMRPDGSDVRNLTNNPAGDWFPTFSADGQWLLFQSDRSGNMDIYRMQFAP